MAVLVPCPCGHHLEIKPGQFGRRVVCPSCRRALWASVPASPPINPSELARPSLIPPALPKYQFEPPPLTSDRLVAADRQQSSGALIGWCRRNLKKPAFFAIVPLLCMVAVLAVVLLIRRSAPTGTAELAQRPAERNKHGDVSIDGQARVKLPDRPAPRADLAKPNAAPDDSRRPDKGGLPDDSPRRQARPLSTQEIVAKAEASVALIKGNSGNGTGFVVGPGLLATNAHVIASEPVRSLQIHFPSAPTESRGPIPARLRYKDALRDLALLSVETRLPSLDLSRSHVFKRGEDVTIIGSPGLGHDVVLPNALTRGIMSTKVELDGHSFYQLGAAVNPGNSGGPAFNDSGEVIGVVTAKAARQESIGFCIPVADLDRRARNCQIGEPGAARSNAARFTNWVQLFAAFTSLAR